MKRFAAGILSWAVVWRRMSLRRQILAIASGAILLFVVGSVLLGLVRHSMAQRQIRGFRTSAAKPLHYYPEKPIPKQTLISSELTLPAGIEIELVDYYDYFFKARWEDGEGWISYYDLAWSKPDRRPPDPTKLP